MDRDHATTLTTINRRSASLPSLLVVAELSSGERTCPLGLSPIVVGTGTDCDLVVDDAAVSRHHCSLTITSHGVLVRDLDSKNGTSIGGVVVREGYLTSTSYARVGGITLRLRVVGAPTEIPLWPGVRFGEVLGGSVAMRALFQRLHQACASAEPILLVGESGTGKELLARAVHGEGPNRDGPFVVFDAGATAPALFESELFGHVRGAFTGAAADRAGILAEAHGGTLFIDEIGELPIELQPKLLRALETKQYRPVGSSTVTSFDARVIAATPRDLRAAVAKEEFRQDLFYRLAVIEARVPPLRERKEDIELLVERFLAAEVPPRTVLDLAPGAMAMLMAHEWPGNVRELRTTVANLVLFPDAVRSTLEGRAVEQATGVGFERLLTLPWREAREAVLDRFEAAFVAAKLNEHGGSVARTAAAMGISRQMVHRLMTRHGLHGGEA